MDPADRSRHATPVEFYRALQSTKYKRLGPSLKVLVAAGGVDVDRFAFQGAGGKRWQWERLKDNRDTLAHDMRTYVTWDNVPWDTKGVDYEATDEELDAMTCSLLPHLQPLVAAKKRLAAEKEQAERDPFKSDGKFSDTADRTAHYGRPLSQHLDDIKGTLWGNIGHDFTTNIPIEEFAYFNYAGAGGYAHAKQMAEILEGVEDRGQVIGAYRSLLKAYMHEHSHEFFPHEGQFHDQSLTQLMEDWGLHAPADTLVDDPPDEDFDVSRYLSRGDRRTFEHHVHGLSNLAGAQPMYEDPHPEMDWNYNAETRMDWHNVADILESFAQHGGSEELEDYLSLEASQRGRASLGVLEHKAKEVFGKAIMRDDLAGDNWQMAHITKHAARRLRRFMKSGEKADRSFRPLDPALAQRHRKHLAGFRDIGYHKYFYPKMDKSAFHRIAKLPGMYDFLEDHHELDASPIPWYLYGRDKYAERWEQDHNELFDEAPKPPEDNFDQVKAAIDFEPQKGALKSIIDALNEFQEALTFLPDGLDPEPPAPRPRVEPPPMRPASPSPTPPPIVDPANLHQHMMALFPVAIPEQSVPDITINRYMVAFEPSSSSDDEDDLMKLYPEVFAMYGYNYG